MYVQKSKFRNLLVISLMINLKCMENAPDVADIIPSSGQPQLWMVSDNGEREMIHAHILLEMSAILRVILKDKRESIFHHAFIRMSLLSFTE